MKKVIIILLCIMPAIQACKDSLGLDPAVQKIPVLPPGDEIGESSPNMYKIDTLIFKDITEKYILNSESYPDVWPEFGYKLKGDIYLDTSKQDFRIWLNIDLTSLNNNKPGITKRSDWIAGLQLKFRAIIDTTKIYLLHEQPGKWNSITLNLDSVDNMATKRINYYGNQLNASLSFSSIDRNGSTIIMNLFVDITTAGNQETKQLSSTIILNYKE